MRTQASLQIISFSYLTRVEHITRQPAAPSSGRFINLTGASLLRKSQVFCQLMPTNILIIMLKSYLLIIAHFSSDFNPHRRRAASVTLLMRLTILLVYSPSAEPLQDCSMLTACHTRNLKHPPISSCLNSSVSASAGLFVFVTFYNSSAEIQ